MISEQRYSTESSQQLYRRAKSMIPGGTQLLSKRPEMFAPERWPAYYQSARGCDITDLDGNVYLDMSTNGIGACLLGYADPDVTATVVRRVQDGSMCSLNPPDEVELAELLLELHPWSEQVRYQRTGGEAMAVAVRLARAATGRDLVAFCGYHGWHDWYLAANRTTDGLVDGLREHLLPGLPPNGVPTQLAGTAVPFAYNNIDQLLKIVGEHGHVLAAVVMEPTRSVDPQPGFLEGVRECCDRVGAALVIDEITAGWRFTLGGAHLRYGLDPDIAVFAKSLGNGHPMAAVLGRSRFMQAAQSSFISSSYWTEAVGPAAALATVRKLQQTDAPAHLQRIGTLWREGLQALAEKHGVPLKTAGHPALSSLAFDHPANVALTTLWTVRMLDKSILAGAGFYPTLAHQPCHLERFLAAADEVFAEQAEAIRLKDIEQRIGSPLKHTGFARLA